MRASRSLPPWQGPPEARCARGRGARGARGARTAGPPILRMLLRIGIRMFAVNIRVATVLIYAFMFSYIFLYMITTFHKSIPQDFVLGMTNMSLKVNSNPLYSKDLLYEDLCLVVFMNISICILIAWFEAVANFCSWTKKMDDLVEDHFVLFFVAFVLSLFEDAANQAFEFSFQLFIGTLINALFSLLRAKWEMERVSSNRGSSNLLLLAIGCIVAIFVLIMIELKSNLPVELLARTFFVNLPVVFVCSYARLREVASANT